MRPKLEHLLSCGDSMEGPSKTRHLQTFFPRCAPRQLSARSGRHVMEGNQLCSHYTGNACILSTPPLMNVLAPADASPRYCLFPLVLLRRMTFDLACPRAPPCPTILLRLLSPFCPTTPLAFFLTGSTPCNPPSQISLRPLGTSVRIFTSSRTVGLLRSFLISLL